MAAPYVHPGQMQERSPDGRAPMLVAVLIAVAAVLGSVIVLLATSDDAGGFSGQQNSPGGGSAPGLPGAGSDGNDAGSVPGRSSTEGGAAASASPLPGGSASGSDLQANFPTPPGTTRVASYGSLTPPTGQQWYLTTSTLAATNTFYAAELKRQGGTMNTAPLTTRDASGNVVGYYYYWHFGESQGLLLSLASNYLGRAPGKVLIRAQFQ